MCFSIISITILVGILHGAYYRTTIAVVAVAAAADAPGRCQPVALYEQRQPQLSCANKMWFKNG